MKNRNVLLLNRTVLVFCFLTSAFVIGCGPGSKTENHQLSEKSEKSELEEIASRSKLASVPKRIQIGPTCGLYALGMVMDYWHSVNSKNHTVLVQSLDLQEKGTFYNFPPTSEEQLLGHVIDKGYSREGEMFSGENLAKTAEYFSYHTKVYSKATLEDLYQVIDQKHPAIVAFDVGPSGDPILSNGEHAHYAVIQGYFDYQDIRYVVASHSWGSRVDYVWKASDLYSSMNNLAYTRYYGSYEDLPKMLSLKPYAKGFKGFDISKSLANKIIEVIPAQSFP